MFTLCMSRGANKHLQDNSLTVNHCGKQVKGGYLLRYKRGWLCRTWSEEWTVLYEDSTVAWYSEKGASTPVGQVRVGDAPELLAVGDWTQQVPHRPRLPPNCQIGQLLALGRPTYHHYSNRKTRVHWLMAQSSAEVSEWMIAISNTLPPPPRLTIDREKRCSVTMIRDLNHFNDGTNSSSIHRTSITQPTTAPSTVVEALASRRSFESDHTIPPGVVIDWGRGWGWGWCETAWATQLACSCSDTGATSALYCGTEDFNVGGYNDVGDYGAGDYGDFCF